MNGWIKIALVILSFSVVGCSKKLSNNMKEGKNQSIDIQGHRGARGLLPENTIPAFLLALDLGVSTLELDVVISKDKQVVVSHEAYFNHEITTQPNGDTVSLKEEKKLNLYKMTYSEISKYDVGMKFHPRFPTQEKIKVSKPTLKAMLEASETYIKKKKLKNIQYNIEIKFDQPEYNPSEKEFSQLVLKEIYSAGIQKRCNIQSFTHTVLNAVHELDPNIKTVILVENKKTYEDHLNKLNHKPYGYSPYFGLVNQDLVDKCKRDNIKLVPWTVNKLDDAQALVKLGVDGIITDYPDLINKISVFTD
jgi:glycerophosphoryl diester phosphodiesterase